MYKKCGAVLYWRTFLVGSNLSFSWIFGCTFVLYQHNTFVINFINYTYSKLVEIWPMSLAPTNEDSGGTWRKTLMVKKTLMWLTYMKKNL